MSQKAVGILVGGGPAPGLNGVIRAATMEALTRGVPVVGIRKGYERLIAGDTSAGISLSAEDVRGIHRTGGSILLTSRANPKKDVGGLDRTLQTLLAMNVGYLVAIGGDDTASSARALARLGVGKLQVVHVPKTIDNDLPLPNQIPTFGFQSARALGVELVDNLILDAQTTGRWYFAVAMGRKAGHLALGIGYACVAPITLIPEEFGDRPVPFSAIVDLVVGAMVKEATEGREFGVAVLAEGLIERIDQATLPEMGDVERDPHGHLRLADVDFGDMMRLAVRVRLKELGLPKWTIVDKNIGYELRCCAPNAFDREYTASLGAGAVDFLLNGGSEAMMSRQRGTLVPIPFAEILDEETGRIRTHYVDLQTDVYQMASRAMCKLRPDDFTRETFQSALKKFTNTSPDELRRKLDLTFTG